VGSTSAFSRSCGQLAEKVQEWAAAVYAACVNGPRINQPSVPGKRCIARGRLCEWQNCSISMDSARSRPAIAGLDPRLSGSESVGVDDGSFSTSSRHHRACPGDPRLLWPCAVWRGWPGLRPRLSGSKKSIVNLQLGSLQRARHGHPRLRVARPGPVDCRNMSDNDDLRLCW
jgi:hypothetical protein